MYQVVTPAGGRREVFDDSISFTELRRQLVEMINIEGPVAEGVLLSRVARAWGMKKTGRKIEELLRNTIPANLTITHETGETFYWPSNIVPSEWDGFRVAGSDLRSKRPIAEICVEEIGNLAMFLLTEHGATTVDDLARSICRLFGISRTTGDAEARVRHALTVGRTSRLVVVDFDQVSMRRVS